MMTRWTYEGCSGYAVVNGDTLAAFGLLAIKRKKYHHELMKQIRCSHDSVHIFSAEDIQTYIRYSGNTDTMTHPHKRLLFRILDGLSQ